MMARVIRWTHRNIIDISHRLLVKQFKPLGLKRFYSSGDSNTPILGRTSQLPIAKPGSDRLIAIFTCKICSLRSAKSFSKKAYNFGIVYVKCSGCSNLHLISDQLGWFGDTKENIEDILLRNGENIHKAELGEDIPEEDIKIMESLKGTKHFD
ncbi:DNL zinc finger domain containing protein [Babesia bovis T2Bo]|uniref:DNL zinc finger domain containing protein n=1 Tax=Babesia bovis TaxID=5865 RepID=A7AWN2_BABBO|nr:DNL zinc finger domain containing protein [Babesia bovis T2Bo]EDO05460.1 DNL zinc finger domain containing protein [Babesia bovis T2Bo]|eukprot:XP_001609028.1 DNL zinc finger domain containing protein [Babesia bovis T2Bo]